MRIVVIGGPQARRLAEAAGLCGADAHWLDGFVPPSPADAERLGGARKLAVQATGTPPAIDLDALAPQAERVVFPEIALDFLWPFGGQPHALNTAMPLLPRGPFPSELGDAWLNRRLDAGLPLAAIEAEYLALDVAAAVDLDVYRRMALERQAALDAAAGADFAARFEEGFAKAPLFANPLEPAPDLFRDLANRVFRKLGAPFSLTPEFRPPWRLAELPIHPSVVRHFGLAWARGRKFRVWPDDEADFGEYVRRYLAFAEGPELESGARMVAEGRAEQGLAALEIATARPIGARSTSAGAAKTRGYLAAARIGEDAAAIPRPAHADPLFAAADACARGRFAEAETLLSPQGSVPAFVLLALAREKRGDAAGGVAALKAALALRPLDGALRGRFIVACAAAGDLAGALGAAEEEAALKPDDPRARALLSHLLQRAGQVERAKEELKRALALVNARPEYAALRETIQRHGVAPDRG